MFTKNQYKTMEGISSGPGEIVALVRIGVVAELVLLIAIKLIAWSKSA